MNRIKLKLLEDKMTKNPDQTWTYEATYQRILNKENLGTFKIYNTNIIHPKDVPNNELGPKLARAKVELKSYEKLYDEYLINIHTCSNINNLQIFLNTIKFADKMIKHQKKYIYKLLCND